MHEFQKAYIFIIMCEGFCVLMLLLQLQVQDENFKSSGFELSINKKKEPMTIATVASGEVKIRKAYLQEKVLSVCFGLSNCSVVPLLHSSLSNCRPLTSDCAYADDLQQCVMCLGLCVLQFGRFVSLCVLVYTSRQSPAKS